MLSQFPTDILNSCICPYLSCIEVYHLYMTCSQLNVKLEKCMKEMRLSYPSNREIEKHWSSQGNPIPIVYMLRGDIVHGRKYKRCVCYQVRIKKYQYLEMSISYCFRSPCSVDVRLINENSFIGGWIDPMTYRDILLSRPKCDKEMISNFVKKYILDRAKEHLSADIINSLMEGSEFHADDGEDYDEFFSKERDFLFTAWVSREFREFYDEWFHGHSEGSIEVGQTSDILLNYVKAAILKV
jgi:hypothetical protein